jgi:hypothetical protein
MKYLLILILFAGCSKIKPKTEENVEYVTVQTYLSKIQFTNKGEPDTLITYVYQDETKLTTTLWIATTTDAKRALNTLQWDSQLFMPPDVQKYYIGRRYPDLKVKRIIITKY